MMKVAHKFPIVLSTQTELVQIHLIAEHPMGWK